MNLVMICHMSKNVMICGPDLINDHVFDTRCNFVTHQVNWKVTYLFKREQFK